jgi:hypothetical protein
MKSIVGNLEYGIPLLQLLQNEVRLTVEGGHLKLLF